MKKRQKLLSDEQWQLIEPLLPKPRPRRDKRGRPPVPNRACLEGILWILQTGAAWHFLPDEFPSPSTWSGPTTEVFAHSAGHEEVPCVWPFNTTEIDPDVRELRSMHCSWCVLDCGKAQDLKHELSA